MMDRDAIDCYTYGLIARERMNDEEFRHSVEELYDEIIYEQEDPDLEDEDVIGDKDYLLESLYNSEAEYVQLELDIQNGNQE